ncbi:MAG: MATE family efflux transporter [Lachnospiraceae bacterium]|nr:MATE family efflux transporter [Lachnospiraceae bacterium]
MENPIGTLPVGKLLRQFAIPSIIAMLVSSLYNVVDQIFIGQGVGYLGNAATNVAFPLVTICMAMTLAIGIGSATQFSLSLGRKEEEEAARVAGSGFLMMVLFGTIYAVLVELFLPQLLTVFGSTPEIMPYALTYTRITTIGMPFLMIMNGVSNLARADGSPRFSMMVMLVGAIINTILDPIFIFPLHMGVAGAAWATIIGQVVSCIYAVLYLRRFKRINLKREHFVLSFRRIGKTFTMGMSNGLTQLAITLIQIVVNNSMVYYGAQTPYGSEIPLAAAGIVLKVNGIIMAVYIGVNQGMQPIIGFNYGAKKFERVKQTFRKAVLAVFVIGLIGLFIFQVFPKAVLSLFGGGEGLYMDFAVRFMRTFLLMIPLNGIQMLSSNFFSAIGKPVKGTLLSLTRTVFLFIPIVLILPLFLSMQGILITAPIADSIAFVIAMGFVGKEMKNMV